MPTFDKRKQELKDRFTMIQGELPFEEVTRILAALDRYGSLRDQVLTDVAFAATDLGRDKKESTYAGALSRGRDVVDALDHMLDGVSEPSDKALAFRGLATVEEQRFWSTLEPLQLGGARDLLLSKHLFIEDYTRVLQAKWSSMSEADEAIDRLERDATDAMNAMLRRAVEGGTPALDRAGQSLRKVTDELKQIKKDLMTFLGDALKEVGVNGQVASTAAYLTTKWLQGKLTGLLGSTGKEVFDALASWYSDVLVVYLDGTFSQKVYELKSRIPNQGAVIATFTTTRREADEFLRTNGFATAQEIWQAVDRAVDGWTSGLLGDGCKADGQAFADYVMEGLSQRLDAVEDVFNTFVSDNQGRFLGSLRLDVEEAMLETRAWEDREASLVNYGLEARLRTWRQGLLDARLLVDNAFGEFSYNLNDLPADVQYAIQTEMNTLRDGLIQRIAALTDQATQAMDTATTQASERALRDAVDRRALRQAIGA
ncbi:MAG TPA: hypothetical protein PKA64_10080 [Myxococcota bacterium]|nr:hypothetical protein [Myxococcota bacterium]